MACGAALSHFLVDKAPHFFQFYIARTQPEGTEAFYRSTSYITQDTFIFCRYREIK